MGQRHATWKGEERESGRRQGGEIMGQVIRSETARINLWNNPLGPSDGILTALQQKWHLESSEK